MKNKANLLFSIVLPLTIILLNISCKKDYRLEEFVEKKMKSREGKPTIFLLDNKSFSAEIFRSELMFERSHLETKQEFPDPQGLRRYLDQYIEESVILEEAMADFDLNNPEVAAYLWPYIRKGIISYYLDKKSGVFDLNQNYSDIDVPEEELKGFYKEHANSFKGFSEKEALSRISNTARFLKWKKLYDIKNESKKNVMGRLKKNHTVLVRETEFNKVGSDL
ncbi:hypothetical protein [Leptospira sarikeiensis]|uniref:Uncharacterized protein n=1 Tax=Leptospira sarikeiensis TaxID=2484943 RepID=A0A4V3JSE5_9LEPT|nr:hypothetical protein [Leptospira sarikeiensis]TGL64210.1 hypothetical protein EHQ64_02425 [Leptospira sarikeiensis]